MKIITIEEALKILGENNPLQGWNEEPNVILYEGDTELKGDLDLDEEGVCGILVTGNLNLEGSIINGEGDYGNFLCIKGSLKAKNIIAGGSEIYIFGDVTIKNAIYAFYNHGTLSIKGKTKATAIINSDDHDTHFKGKIEGIKIDTGGGDTFNKADFYGGGLDNILNGELIDADGYVREDKIIKAILSDKEFLKKAAKPHHVQLSAALQKLITKNSNTTELILSGKNLKEFPEIITELKSLKILRIDNDEIKKLPAFIGNLTHLEELHIHRCNLTTLPSEIGKLQNLKILDISGNHIKTLPKELAQLKNLEKLWAACSFEIVPEVIGEMQNLEELILTGESWRRIKEFPAHITKLKKLKKLDLSGHPFKVIPDEILNMESLEELDLSNSLSYLKSIPNLSKMKKLKNLFFAGGIKHSNDPYPSPELLEQVFKFTGLEQLAIDRWGEQGLRPALKTLPDGIGEFAHLKILDVSFNDITHLPESFFKLTNLRNVNFGYNSELPFKEFEKLISRLPNTKFNFANVPFRQSIKDEYWQKVHNSIKVGVLGMKDENYPKAIKAFKEVVALCVPGKKWSEYDHICAYYGKMYSLFEILKNTSDKKKQAKFIAECEGAATTCLSLTSGKEKLMYFNYESAFYLECIQRASNILASLLMESVSKSDVKNLQKALDYTEKGLATITPSDEFYALYIYDIQTGDMLYYINPEDYYIHHTKVRILLKMNRSDEAYTIVRQVLDEDPYFENFEDIKKNKEYKAWLKKNL